MTVPSPVPRAFAVIAADDGDLAVVRQFLAEGGSPDASYAAPDTLLHYAVRRRHVDIVRLLIEAGADVNRVITHTDTVLGSAIRTRFGSRAQAGAVQPAPGVLTDEDRRLRLEIVRLLLAAGADPNLLTPKARVARVPLVQAVVDRFYEPPLLAAIKEGDVELADVLLEAGADLEQPDAFDFTPLMSALMTYREGMVRLLLARGARVDVAGSQGQTPLALAIEMRRLDRPGDPSTIATSRSLVDLLLRAGARPGRADAKGRTELWHCIDADDEVLLVRLLAVGADPAHCDGRGVTARQYALALGRHGLAARLLDLSD